MKKRLHHATFAIFSAAFLFQSTLLLAAGTGKYALGPLVGFAFSNTSSSALAWGGQLTAKFNPSWGISASYLTYGVSINSTSTTSTVAASNSQTLILAETDYYFSGSPGQLSLGVAAGLGKSEISASGAIGGVTSVSIADSNSGLIFGPALNYDRAIGVISIGGSLSYLFALSDATPSGIFALFNAKFWF